MRACREEAETHRAWASRVGVHTRSYRNATYNMHGRTGQDHPPPQDHTLKHTLTRILPRSEKEAGSDRGSPGPGSESQTGPQPPRNNPVQLWSEVPVWEKTPAQGELRAREQPLQGGSDLPLPATGPSACSLPKP